MSRSCGMPQDGYAVVSSDGIGDYDVAFEALAGTAAGHLKAGTVAYITTGTWECEHQHPLLLQRKPRTKKTFLHCMYRGSTAGWS